MKLTLLAFVLSLVGAKSVLACSPPRNFYVIQSTELNRLTEDKDVQGRIFNLLDRGGSVESITHADRSYIILLSSKCAFSAKPIYTKPPSNGMCPGWGGFQLSETVCPADTSLEN